MPGTDKTRIIVQCSRCPTEYSANRQHYNVAKRAGKPNFCPACLAQIRQGNARTATRIRTKRQEIMATEFMAPCRMKIVPAREGISSRCKPALAGRCPMVEDCVDFTARNAWDGWRVANDG